MTAERLPGDLVAVFAGGAIGTLARAGLVELAPPDPSSWPWVTFAVNVAGAALLGFVMSRAPARGRAARFLGSGLCGALTTFSALQLELLLMLDEGSGALALAYAAASLAAGLAAVTLARRAV